MKRYNEFFTYAYPIIGDDGVANFMEHTDGCVSCAIAWDGIDYESKGSQDEVSQSMKTIYGLFAAASKYTNLFMEHHLFRGFDAYWADRYYQYGVDNFRSDRNPEFAKKIRKSLADHYAGFSRHNDNYIVFLLKPKVSIFNRSPERIADRYRQLFSIVNELMSFIPGEPRLLDIDEYQSLILRHNSPAVVRTGRDKINYNWRFDATFKLVAPVVESRCVRTSGGGGDSCFHRVIVLLDYPDALQGWPARLSRDNSEKIHVVQITNPMDTQMVTLKSARETDRSNEAAHMIGGEAVMGKLNDHAHFRNFIQQNNLTVHANNYVIVISGETVHDVNSRHSDLCRYLRDGSGAMIVTDDPETELYYYKITTPGMGYKTPYLRPDHHWQVANMTPCFSQSHGNMDHPEMAFITSVSTLVGVRLRRGSLHHALAAAKTGSGKSVTMAAMIAQLYPLGFNFYITEVGRSYEFLVRAFGGEYHVLDPDQTVVSPLAAYSEMRSIKNNSGTSISDDGEEQEFSVTAVTTMRNCLMPIMLSRSDVDNHPDLIHCQSALDDIITLLYKDIFVDPNMDGPTLQTLLEKGRILHASFVEDQDYRADNLLEMLNNLESFLATSEGKVFTKANTLNFNSGLIGLDFGHLIHGNANNLAKYLLLFTATRLQQLSFINPEQTFLVFDEDHEYTNIDKKLMNLLKSQVTKRGRKHAAFLFPISQVVRDIAYSDDGTVNSDVINQMNIFMLLYYGTDHGELADVFKLPERAANIWKSYVDPLESHINYRQGLFVQSGKFIDMHLTWPALLSAITNSNPDAIAYKDKLLQEEGFDNMMKVIDRFIMEYVE